MDPRNRSAGQSDFVPVPTDTDFGDPAQWSPDANNGTKIDPYSATQLYGQPWDGYDGAQARFSHSKIVANFSIISNGRLTRSKCICSIECLHKSTIEPHTVAQ